MDDSVVIVLLRHGVTEENRRGAYIGWTNAQLSEKATFTQVGDENVDLVFTSDLDRCTQSVKRLFPMKDAIEMMNFRELHFGSWEGKTYAELEADERYRTWLEDPSVAPPGGESFKMFTDRIDEGFDSVVNRMSTNRRAALVTHGGVIRYLLTKYAPAQRTFWDWTIPHGTGVKLVWKINDLRRGERCTSLQVVHSTENPSG
ncbi:histidine phosphatase family protein [Alkalihalobacillus sp. CinArs1]|uniref:histidine phosphatase family protein n=1 Tax=Alkalihalobacillus sp. CinArs1 TaxID=2995314 RepID=UPI0022DE4BBD|nr:histidine phosphatase family protein [Alkalihalobacillus sp. CinArs1]